MNSNESQNPSTAGQPQPAPAPNSGPEQSALPAAAPTGSNAAQPVSGPIPSSTPAAAAAPAEAPTADPPALSVPARVRKKRAHVEDPTFGGVLGKLERLSPAEEAELFACEQVIESGWATFVQVGLALATIKDNELYRTVYGSFEHYCRDKWQYSERYAYQLISAAQVFRQLCANCAEHKPCHEAQVRPLVGLTLEQACSAWNQAVKIAGATRITARLVKRAMHELQIAPPLPPRPIRTRESKANYRRIVDDAIGDLLGLLRQKAAHETLIQKVELLHQQIQPLLRSRNPAKTNEP